jgi:hypothetical protein
MVLLDATDSAIAQSGGSAQQGRKQEDADLENQDLVGER